MAYDTETTITITNKKGLHARAAAKFVKAVGQFDAKILVAKIAGAGVVVGAEIAESSGGPVGGGDWSTGTGRNRAGKKRSEGKCGEANSAVGDAWHGVGGVGSSYAKGCRGRSLGMGERKMRNREELRELVRQAVVETLRKKVPVLDGQRIGADLGAESIDRIDLTFRLEEAVGKALEDKILFAEPDPTVAELAERLRVMLGKKK